MNYLFKQRQTDLFYVYTQLLEQREVVVASSIFQEVVNHPAPQFYISTVCALAVIRSLLRGESLKRMNRNKRDMYQEIFVRYKDYLCKHPGVSGRKALNHILQEPAPRFYISPTSARIYIHRIRKQWHAKKMERLSHLL